MWISVILQIQDHKRQSYLFIYFFFGNKMTFDLSYIEPGDMGGYLNLEENEKE